jgi:uncharacterized protein involved in response to NO
MHLFRAAFDLYQGSGGAAGYRGRMFFAAGFRPFFLLAALWAAIAVPLWLATYAHGYAWSGALPGIYWHGHEMVFGYGLAAVGGFLLTAIPNWTNRLPVSGAPLGALAGLWIAGRIAGFTAAGWLDLAFPAALIAVIARELIAGRNWRNLPMLIALGLLFAADLLVHFGSPALGIRLGLGVLLALIALVGGRIVPSFTRNWLARMRPDVPSPAPMSRFDLGCLVTTLIGLGAWVVADGSPASHVLEAAGGAAAALRLARWRGLSTAREPLLLVLHAGYFWLALGLLLSGLNGLFEWLPPSAPLHALSVGAVGTMTLAVMTRATLGHSGRPLAIGAGTVAIYVLVSLAAVLRMLSPLSAHALVVTAFAGVAWIGAFALFALLYGPLLLGIKR